MITSQILLPSDPGWSELLQRTPHDFYHTAAYHAFSERAGEGFARMAAVTDGDQFLVWPYLQRPAQATGCDESADWFDIHSVYGYPGPLSSPNASAEFIGNAMDAIMDRWLQERVVSVFSRFHPLLANTSILRGTKYGDGIFANGQTVALDLARTTEECRAHYPQRLRQRLNRLTRLGTETTVDNDFEHLDQFVDFYYSTMQRNAAASSYYFPRSYFHTLVREMAPCIKLLITRVEGKIAVASLFSVYGSIAQAHFIMTNPEYLALSPSKATIDHARLWAFEQGCCQLHLGGGRGGKADSLFGFKSEFSPLHYAFDTCRITVNEHAANQLTEQRANAARALGLSEEPSGYFPPYREPMPVAQPLPEEELSNAS